MLSFETRAGALFDALSTVSRAVASRDLIPALTGVHVDGRGGEISLTATDLELGLRTKLPVKLSSEGEALLPARPLAELLRRVPPAENVEFKILDGSTAIRFGKSRFDLPTYSVKDFPRLSFEPEGKAVTLPVSQFREAIGRVVYASAQREDSLPVLLGVKLALREDGSLECCASDNFRLAWGRIHTQTKRENEDVVVRSRALSELMRLLGDDEIKMCVGERQVTFTADRVQAFCSLVDGTFPDHTKLVRDSYQTNVRFAVEDLLVACERASLVADPKSPQVTIKAGAEGVSMSSGSPEAGSSIEEIPAEVEGEDLEITFNPRFLADSLKYFGHPQAEFGFNGPTSAARLKPVDSDDALSLVLPIRRM